MTDYPPLTVGDADALHNVLDTTRVVKVAYAREDCEILYGTARCLVGDADLGPRDIHADVRDAYLRITTRSGMEVAFPVTELMEANRQGRFLAYDW